MLAEEDTHEGTIRNTIQVAGISRSTLYYWMERAWIHWRELPSNRRVICQESLSNIGHKRHSAGVFANV